MSEHSNERSNSDGGKRWWAFGVLFVSNLMMVLDGTIVNVALPSIKTDLVFSETSLVWIINAYLLTFASFLLLGGRLGDLFGHRRLFLFGMMLFTLASLGCGLATSQGLLIGGRAVQGIGSAVVSAVSLPLTISWFPQVFERARALGIYAFTSVAGSSLGLFLGGMLTSALNWHWIFFINVPIGVAVYIFGYAWPADKGSYTAGDYVDAGGAMTGALALMLTAYAIFSGNDAGWTSVPTLTLLAAAGTLLVLFIGIEARARTPIMPLGLFRRRNLVAANIAGALWCAATVVWCVISSLYMQLVLGCTSLQSGIAFLPATVITAIFSVGPLVRLLTRFGTKLPLGIGLLLTAAGLVYFARSRVDGTLASDVLPGMLLVGVGGGMTSTPLLLAAMADVAPSESGIGSGVLSTSLIMGGALGLALLSGVAASRTQGLLTSGVPLPIALNSGYHMAFVCAAAFAIVAAVGTRFLRIELPTPVRDHGESVGGTPVRVLEDGTRNPSP